MKKILCCVLILMLIIAVTGCGDKNKNSEVSDMLSGVTSVKLVDVVNDMYEEELIIELSEDFSSRLVKAINNADAKETSFTGYLSYGVEVYVDETMVEKILVDTQDTVALQSGKNFIRSGELDDILTEIEKFHQIDKDIWSRKPGISYFGMFEIVNHGKAYEITGSNFVEGVKVNLSDEDCVAIANSINEPIFSESTFDNINKKYVFNFYSQDGASIYTIFVDDEWNIYTDGNYKIDCISLENELKNIIG